MQDPEQQAQLVQDMINEIDRTKSIFREANSEFKKSELNLAIMSALVHSMVEHGRKNLKLDDKSMLDGVMISMLMHEIKEYVTKKKEK